MITEHHLRIGARAVLLLEGPRGWGECSPLAGYPCTFAAARAAAEEAAAHGWPDPVRDLVSVSGHVTAADLRATDEAVVARLAGFPAVKLKVGRAHPEEDVAAVARLRALLGPDIAIRIDANGAWDVETAVDTLARLAHFDLEFAEQPVATLDELAAVHRRVSVPIAADESVRSVADARRLAVEHAADVIVLKVQPLGGVRAALAIADAAAVPPVVTSMYETSIGLAAGLALAVALPDLSYACGLATLDVIAGDVVDPPLAPHLGVLCIPDAFPPEPAPKLLTRYRVVA